MFHQTSDLPIHRFTPTLVLDYGTDEIGCEDTSFEVSQRGMSFQSQWEFPIGTRLSVALTFPDDGGEQHRLSCEGVVVSCESTKPHCFHAILLFDDSSAPCAEMMRKLGAAIEKGEKIQAAL